MVSARTFDLKIQSRDGETTFSSINKEEHELVENFLKSKKLRVKNEINDDMLTGAVADLEDSDEDMESAESSEAEQPSKSHAADADSEEGPHSNQFYSTSIAQVALTLHTRLYQTMTFRYHLRTKGRHLNLIRTVMGQRLQVMPVVIVI
jgi:hypothetical protein